MLAAISCGSKEQPPARSSDAGAARADTADARGASTATGPAATANTATAPSAPRIVVLGDSLTAGLGIPRNEAYPAVLQRKLQDAGIAIDVVNAGISGDTSADGVRRVNWALDGDVRLLIVALGANDGLRGLPPTQMKANLQGIIHRARQRGVPVLLAGMEAPPNYGEQYASAFRQVFQELARENKVAFVPFLLDGVAGVADLNQSDGVHPTSAGAVRIADHLWPTVKTMITK